MASGNVFEMLGEDGGDDVAAMAAKLPAKCESCDARM
jgi:hypothetical protein